MIPDALALTTLSAGSYAVWCALPGDADAAEIVARESSAAGGAIWIAFVLAVLLLIWKAMRLPARVRHERDAREHAEWVDAERIDAAERRAREAQS